MENEIIKKYGNKKTAYFDIETTGFSSKTESIYLIGAAYKNDDDSFTLVQWLDDTSKDEAKMLLLFREFLKSFDVLINFNGNTFDVPFVLNRAMKYGIHFSIDKLIMIDIYKEIKKYKNFFKTPDLKQKSIEVFLGINREDEYNGGQLIEVYREFISLTNNNTKKNELLTLLLLHNHDDLIGLVNICDIYAYLDIFSGKFSTHHIELEEQYLILRCILESPLKMPIFDLYHYAMCGNRNRKNKSNETMISNLLSESQGVFERIKIEAHGNFLNLMIPVLSLKLKYFYENYKDYYYLPDEDMAIHKSVAQFVDKSHRKKATKENCYIKKAGMFAVQMNQLIQPAFQLSHNNKLLFFEVNEDCISRLRQELVSDVHSCSLADEYVKELLCGMYL